MKEKVYYYTIREISKEQFESTNLYRFFAIYSMIFMNKAMSLSENSKVDILQISPITNAKPLNTKISQHVLNSKEKAKREKRKFSPKDIYTKIFNLEWHVRIEPSNIIEMRENHIFRTSYQKPYKLLWKYPEINTRDEKTWFVSKWKTFTVFFDMQELQSRIQSLIFANTAKITVGDRVTFALGFKKAAEEQTKAI